YFGEELNHLLVKKPNSIWELALSANLHIEQGKLPNVLEIFEHCAKTVCTKDFGIPRYPTQQQAHHLPVEYIKQLSLDITRSLRRVNLSETDWPIALGYAIQKALNTHKSPLNHVNALTIVMESAVPMSKIDLFSELVAQGQAQAS
ncbi:MAG: hypothetical protein ACRCWR_05125, partial [Saezia sp.]